MSGESHSREELESIWRRRLKECSRSGLSKRKWCKQRKIAEHRLYYWQRRLGRPAGQKSDAESESQTSFLELISDQLPGAYELGLPADNINLGSKSESRHGPVGRYGADSFSDLPVPAIEIILGGGRRVAVRPGFDPEALSSVLAVLEKSGC